jgi:DNA primase
LRLRDRYPKQFLDELRARLPVSEVVGQRVELYAAEREGERKGLSPFVKEAKPSLYVNDQARWWIDFAFGKSGDIFDFVMETEGVSLDEAVKQLAARTGIPGFEGGTVHARD